MAINKNQRERIAEVIETIITRMEKLDSIIDKAEDAGDSAKVKRCNAYIKELVGKLEGIDTVLTVLGLERWVDCDEDGKITVTIHKYGDAYADALSRCHEDPYEDPTPEQEAGWAFEDRMYTWRTER